jgi:hypothetical protein
MVSGEVPLPMRSVIVPRVWSPERVRDVAASLLDGDAVDAALAAIQPGWRLLWGVDDAQAVVRVGGPASLVEGEEWPRNSRGIPLTLLCEIDTGRLPAMPEEWSARVNLPADAGVLRVFGDLVDDPYAPTPALISPRPPGEPRRVAAPAIPEPFPPGGADDAAAIEHRMRELPETGCSATPFFSRCRSGDPVPSGRTTRRGSSSAIWSASSAA